VVVTVVAHVQHRRTVLRVAAEEGHTDCVRLLLEAGAKKDAIDVVRDIFYCFFYLSIK
jgi:hypothetical protein